MRHKNRGFLEAIVIIVIALLIISYFNINLRSLVQNPTTQQNASYVETSSVSIWNTYLEKPATYVWNTVIVGLLWNSALNAIKNSQSHQTDPPQQPSAISTP